AGIVAIADQVAGHGLGPINPALYRMEAAHDAGIVDVIAGTNTVTFPQSGGGHPVQGWDAGNGYGLASGVGDTAAAQVLPGPVAVVGGSHHGPALRARRGAAGSLLAAPFHCRRFRQEGAVRSPSP